MTFLAGLNFEKGKIVIGCSLKAPLLTWSQNFFLDARSRSWPMEDFLALMTIRTSFGVVIKVCFDSLVMDRKGSPSHLPSKRLQDNNLLSASTIHATNYRHYGTVTHTT